MKNLVITSLFLLLSTFIFGQRCISEQIDESVHQFTQRHQNDVIQRTTVTIPVIVNVVYKNTADSISYAQAYKQIDILNKDFNHPQIQNVPDEFKPFVANMGIEFCLYKVNYRKTNVDIFSTNDNMKRYENGGINATYVGKALNIWVCRLNGGTLGYSTSPHYYVDDTEGVVIGTQYFGITSTSLYGSGRTTTHEVGHWLGLLHIWGDNNCGTDWVDDTPPQTQPTIGCPSITYNKCVGVTPNTIREMNMNFMDYTNDDCMSFFTKGQKAKVWSLFVFGGAKFSYTTSTLCNSVLAIDSTRKFVEKPIVDTLKVFPNPTTDNITVTFGSKIKEVGQIQITNSIGQIVLQKTIDVKLNENRVELDIYDFKQGVYYITLKYAKETYTKKIIKN